MLPVVVITKTIPIYNQLINPTIWFNLFVFLLSLRADTGQWAELSRKYKICEFGGDRDVKLVVRLKRKKKR